MDAENGADSVDDSDSLGNSGSKKSNLTPTSATPTTAGTAAKEKRNRPFFKKVGQEFFVWECCIVCDFEGETYTLGITYMFMFYSE